MLIQAIYKVLFLTRTGTSYFEGADVNKKVDILNEHLKTILLIYELRQSQSEPARATQNHPELARATQESPRTSQSQLEPTRARREPMKI